jgi:hypothetical protein
MKRTLRAIGAFKSYEHFCIQYLSTQYYKLVIQCRNKKVTEAFGILAT